MMRLSGVIPHLRRGASGLLVTLAVVSLVVAAGSVAHCHTGSAQGLYNQEHDLSYLATFGSAALQPAADAAATLVIIALSLIALAPRRPPVAPRRHADPRAPPLR
jgi:hypothetical protein